MTLAPAKRNRADQSLPRQASADSHSDQSLPPAADDEIHSRFNTENRRLAAIVQQSEDGIVQLAPAGQVITINDAAKQFFAIDIDNTANFHFAQLFDEMDQKAIAYTLAKILNKEAVSPLVLRKPANNSTDFFVYEFKFSPLYDNHKVLYSIVVVIRDVSLVYRQQEELRLVIEQAPNALILIDQHGNIAVTNAQAETLFGYNTDDLIGQSIEILVPDTIRARHPDLRQQFMQSPKARAMGAGRDLTAQRKDGSKVAVEIGLNPINTRSGQFVVASIVDITERKRSQQQLEQINQELQQKNNELEQFIYTVSHDLKTPLVTISGFNQRLRQSLLNTISDKQKHQLDRIDANIVHMEKLLNDLLGLSQVIHKEMKKTLINTKDLIGDVLSHMEELISQHNVTVNLVHSSLRIYGNENLLAQCLQNLIVNAINYRHPKRAPAITINQQEREHIYLLSVADNGIGIEEKYFAKIFRIFERLNVGEGTGVGLAIVKTIMEKHGGKVTVSSIPDKGSTFTLYLPKPVGH